MTEALDQRLLDSHCHAWRTWPYAPLVPDEASRGTVEQLLYELDTNGVAEAMVVCAGIDNNPDNVNYVSFAHQRHPDRLHVVADLDCVWHATHHRQGSADRLRALADRYDLVGFTHYVAAANDGWLASDEADALWTAARERHLLVSLSATPAWQADLRRLAQHYPDVPVLCHHLAGVTAADADTGLRQVIQSAACPNVYIKVSGFHYASARGWDHPWPDGVAIFRRIFEAFGPDRLCWGSDFPASDRYCTYRQSLEVVRTHCDFLTDEDRARIMGGTLRAILSR